jgi:prepilin-type processing-associated H-X9-DG protein
VLGRARESARIIQCSSNLRTIATASLQYSFDHRGHFLPSVIWKDVENEPVDFWPHLLQSKKYLPRQDIKNISSPIAFNSVFVCPSTVELTQQNSMIDGVRRAQSKVVQPVNLANPVPFIVDFSYGINGTSYANSGANALYPCTSISYGTLACPQLKKQTKAKKAAEVVFMFDGKEWNVWNESTNGANIISTRIAGWRHGQWRADKPDSSGRVNVSFMDGHVETVPRAELPNVKAASDGLFTDPSPALMSARFPRYKWRLDQ